jgi:hypothetical protein
VDVGDENGMLDAEFLEFVFAEPLFGKLFRA